MKPYAPLPVLVLLLASAAGWAQTSYKSTMPDGKVVYGEKPEPGAQRVDAIAAPPAKAGITVITPAEKARSQQPAPGATAAAAKQRELDAARQQLQQAEAALASGKEPLPGERLGLAGGGSRLTDEYWKRQQGLEQAVASAKKRVEAAELAMR